MRIYSKYYVIKELSNKNTVSESKCLARELGYLGRWIRELIKKIKRSNNNELNLMVIYKDST